MTATPQKHGPRGSAVRASWVARHRRPLSKVPEIIVLFWVTKILTTGMGEAASDYLVDVTKRKLMQVTQK